MLPTYQTGNAIFHEEYGELITFLPIASFGNSCQLFFLNKKTKEGYV